MLLVMAGVFLPCCGIDDCCAVNSQTSSSSPFQKETGSCSPFFTCATCIAIVDLPATLQLQHVDVAQQVEHHSKIILFSSLLFYGSCWQPPRNS